MSKTPVSDAECLGTIKGIRFYRIRSDKFKTARTDIFFSMPLSAETASANALVPALLRRGCLSYPSSLSMERKLEDLYGASFDYEATKKGETQIIHLGLAHVADRYASGGESLFADSAAFLAELLTHPVLVEGVFREDEFRQERDNLVDSIRSRINDKIRYASLRCVEEMCRGEAYAIHAEGGESEASALTARDVTVAWRGMLRERPAYVYFSGEIPDADIHSAMEAFAALDRDPVPTARPRTQAWDGRTVKHLDEIMDVNQGKMCMGLRTQLEPDSSDWPVMLVYNGILGGDLHSKLFQNVREKASLAYYASSRLERHKGILFINSGIEAANRAKAEAIILEQLEDMKQGNITEGEYEATLRSLNTAFKATQDSQAGIVDFHFGQHLLGTGESFESLSEKVAGVTREDVVRVAQNIELDTVYFLQPADA